jgi:hypothetical protein
MRRLWVGCLAVALAAGCRSGDEVPVRGVVTLDGRPLAGASVTFYPEKGTAGLGGAAQTGPDGTFAVVGVGGEAGLLPGTYRVTVSKGTRKTAGDPEQEGAIIPELDLKDELPPTYSHPGQTVLSYPVTGDGKPIAIKLESSKKKR